MSSEDENSRPPSEIGNLSDKVLNSFVSKLAEDTDYEEVSERLKAVVFDEVISEKKLRVALFGEEE